MQTISDMWNNMEVPLVDGLITEDNKFIKIEYRITHVHNEVYRFDKDKSEVEDLYDAWDGESVTSIHVLHSVKAAEHFVYVGEGGYGTQGFVACTDGANQLQWILVLQRSNPFVDVQYNGRVVVATSSYKFALSLDLQQPEKTFI